MNHKTLAERLNENPETLMLARAFNGDRRFEFCGTLNRVCEAIAENGKWIDVEPTKESQQ